MKRLLFQAVFLAMGMIMGVYASGDVGLDLMCGALVAVCCAAVGEYASGSWLAMTLIVMLDCGACLVPAWYLMLPIAAFNAASSSAVVDGSRFLQALVPRWLWLLPMTIVIFRSIGSHVPSDLSIIILMVLQTVLGFAAGLLCTRCANLAREVRRLQDSRRDQIRRLRSQSAVGVRVHLQKPMRLRLALHQRRYVSRRLELLQLRRRLVRLLLRSHACCLRLRLLLLRIAQPRFRQYLRRLADLALAAERRHSLRLARLAARRPSTRQLRDQASKRLPPPPA